MKLTKRKDGRYCTSRTIDGERVFFYSGESTEKKAVRDIEKQMLEYTKKKEASKSFESIAENWDREHREKISDINYRKNTKAAYNRILSHFSQFGAIDNITLIDINLFLSKLMAQGFYKKTIATHKSILNMIFQYALLHGFLTYNPMSDIRLPNNLPRLERQMPSTEDIKIIDSHYKGFDLLPYFLLYTGLRKSEALALSYKDIDFKNKLITVKKHLIYDGNKPIIEDGTKTVNSRRSVVLLDRLAEKLQRNRIGLIFCNDDGSPYKSRQYDRLWRNYQKKYGLTITAHQLRHAYATMLFEAGVDLKDAQDLMGHSDINLTRQIYTHIRDERKFETMSKLNAFNF